MHELKVASLSKRQLSKLRNGHKVRVSKHIEGEGCCLIVRPETYHSASRSFALDKGIHIELNPEEIQENHAEGGRLKLSGEMLKQVAKKASPLLKYATKHAVKHISGDDELGEASSSTLGNLIDGAGLYLGRGKGFGLKRSPLNASNTGLISNIRASQNVARLGLESGRTYGALETSGIINCKSADMGASLSNATFHARRPEGGKICHDFMHPTGGKVHGISQREYGITGRHGRLLMHGSTHQALTSQPYSANYQFQSSFQPQFQGMQEGKVF